MVRLFLSIACISLLALATLADVEHEEHGHGHDHHDHHHAHDGHDHHDHEAHKEFLTGKNMRNAEEEQEKLREIAMHIDTDQDGKITREEMRNYVEKRFKELHVREADDFISTLDPSKTEQIAFKTYIRENYGDMNVDELQQKDKSDSRSREARRNYASDKAKWTHLDQDGDEYLTYEQFRKFLRPEDHDDLRKLEINTIIKEYDEDNDGKISNDEYLKLTEAESGTAEPLGEELDTDKDGFGDFEEFARYYLPSLSLAVDEETDHLFKECDQDKKGHCTPTDIVSAYGTFLGSQATDFGADLEVPKEEL